MRQALAHSQLLLLPCLLVIKRLDQRSSSSHLIQCVLSGPECHVMLLVAAAGTQGASTSHRATSSGLPVKARIYSAAVDIQLPADEFQTTSMSEPHGAYLCSFGPFCVKGFGQASSPCSMHASPQQHLQFGLLMMERQRQGAFTLPILLLVLSSVTYAHFMSP